jgi:hypothetical protein
MDGDARGRDGRASLMSFSYQLGCHGGGKTLGFLGVIGFYLKREEEGGPFI